VTCFCGFSKTFPICDNTHNISRSVKDQIIKNVSNYFNDNDNPNLEEIINLIKKTKGPNIDP
jgi:CDGSH-type Zn-finger protein